MDKADNPLGVEVVAYIDDDDNSYDNFDFHQTQFIRGPRIVLSQMWNRCWQASTGEIFGHMGDDIIFRTKGWDRVVREAFSKFPDRILFAYGDDGSNESARNDFGTHGFIHKNWTDVVGYFVPPYYVSDYNDTHLNDISKALDRHHHIDILTEHMHYTLGKSEIDQNTKDRLERHEKERPQDIYASPEKDAERQEQILQLRKFIHAFKA